MGIVTPPAAHRAARAALFGVFLLAINAVPTQAQHRARLSADLTEQLAVGSQAIDVIVHGDRATVDGLASRYNVVVKRYLRSGAVLRVTSGQLAALQQDNDVDHLSGDVRLRSSVDVTAETIGADQVWAGVDGLAPLSGRGITVAVIDSGIDVRHDALKQRVVATVDFTGGEGQDGFGHGTHVAGIIAGQAGSSADTADYRGIAFGAYLVNLRVLGDDGSGTASDVVEAIDWTIEHRQQYNVRIINLSLGAPVLQPYRDDPLCEAVERAVHAGLVVVAAAGNYGKTADGKVIFGAITSPGNSPHAITVGALDTHQTPQRSDDTVAPFSSRGPTLYDLILKPDVVAPGVHVVSAEAAGSYLAVTYPERHVAGSGTNGYLQLSGTSMAAGVVSGAVALMLEGRDDVNSPGLTVALRRTSSSLSAGLLSQGAGEINVIAAVRIVARGTESDLTATIAGQIVSPDGLVLLQRRSASGEYTVVCVDPITSSTSVTCSQTIIWGSSVRLATLLGGYAPSLPLAADPDSQTIIWGSRPDPLTIIWDSGTVSGAGATPQTIIWGSSAGVQTVIWGSTVYDSISPEDNTPAVSIVWRGSVPESYLK